MVSIERILLPAAGGVGCALARMLRLAAQRLRRPCRAATFGAAAAAAGGAAVAFAWSAPAQAATMAENRPLGGPSARHRVALTAWPINDDPCGTFSSAQELFAHAKRAGYDGLELTVDDFRKSFFPGRTYQEITREVRTLSASSGVQIVGSLYHVSDGGWRREHEDGAPGRWDLDFNDPDFWEALDERVQADKELGSEYVTFQISLPPEHLNTGGEYRDDRAYVQRAAERIARMQEVVFRHGLNFYVETHIDRLSEDVVQTYQMVFEMLDIDGGGTIDFNEFKVLMGGKIVTPHPRSLPHQRWVLIAALDR